MTVRFEHPMTVTTTPGEMQEVANVEDAYKLLMQMPAHSQGYRYDKAVHACRAALAGELEPDTAARAFERFAQRRGMLMPSKHARAIGSGFRLPF